MPALDAVLQEKSEALREQNRLRVAEVRADDDLISFTSNDYLGLAQHPEVIAASVQAAEAYGAGASASRVLTGTHPPYPALENALAEHKGTQAACVFGSGYLANIGTIPALVGREDLIIADKLVHACIVDAMRLSGAKCYRFKHNDAADCARLLKTYRQQYRHCLVITETVFSMDGDVASLQELQTSCKEHDAWLMTDDAHGIQTCENPADIQMGTLSKAFASYGGYVCGSKTLIQHLHNTARSFLFSTGLPPAVVAAATKAVEIARAEPERAENALAHAQKFTDALALPRAQSPIVPLIMGEEAAALVAAEALQARGFLVMAIRPPTVPEGSSRLRFVFTAAHEQAQVDGLIKAVKEICDARISA